MLIDGIEMVITLTEKHAHRHESKCIRYIFYIPNENWIRRIGEYNIIEMIIEIKPK